MKKNNPVQMQIKNFFCFFLFLFVFNFLAFFLCYLFSRAAMLLCCYAMLC